MKKNTTPSFIHELRLNVTPSQMKILNIRLDTARQIYNACLGEGLMRLKLMRDSKGYQTAIKMPKQIKNKQGKLVNNQARKEQFKMARDSSGFIEYDLHKYLSQAYSKSWLSQHVDSVSAQVLATRAFKTVEQYAYGKRGKPRFKGKNQFSSVEGKRNDTGIQFDEGKIVWSRAKKGGKNLEITPRYDLKDKDGLEAYALSERTKYVRLVRRVIKGHFVWYAQLVQEGLPYLKAKHKRTEYDLELMSDLDKQQAPKQSVLYVELKNDEIAYKALSKTGIVQGNIHQSDLTREKPWPKLNRLGFFKPIESGLISIVKQRAHIQPKDPVVGLDLGPSTIAVVGKDQAILQAFCPELKDCRDQIKRVQRKMSRSLRSTNSENFEPDRRVQSSNGKQKRKLGKVKKGAASWKRSKEYQRLRTQVAEAQRKMAAARKAAHGNLANKIFRVGSIIKTEKLSYKGWQKRFGRSVGFRAPGLFVEMLRRKAESAGGEVIEFNTRTTALSQTCHCGHKKKKPLKERWHDCAACGVKAQRDLYSAFLARFVENERLDATNQVKAAWLAGADVLLEQAASNLKQTVTGKHRLASFGLGQRQSGSPLEKESIQHKALDVVACAKV